MSEYKLKTPKGVEKTVVGVHKKIEDTVLEPIEKLKRVLWEHTKRWKKSLWILFWKRYLIKKKRKIDFDMGWRIMKLWCDIF